MAGDNEIRQEKPLSADEQRDRTRIQIGEQLRTAREACDMSLGEACERLRIRKPYLQGLESGDWTDLPEEVYVMGFLRQYAALVGTDVSQNIGALKPGVYQLTKPFTMPDPPIAMNRGWAIAAASCFLLLLVLFNVVDEDGEEFAPAIMQDMLSPAHPLANDKRTAQTLGAGEPLTSEPEPTARDVPEAGDQAAPAPDAPLQTTPASHTNEAAGASSDASGEISGPEPVREPTYRHRFRLTAVDQNVWLQLYARDGSKVKEALLRPGQTLSLSTNETLLLLTSGNPLALSIEIDGKRLIQAGMLGEKNKVLRDYPLTPPAAEQENDR